MSCSEQNETPEDSPSAGSQQESQVNEERGDECSSTGSSGGGSSSGSSSESNDGDDSELVPFVPETPLQKPVASTHQKKSVENSQDLTNKKTVRRFRTLRDIDLPHFNGRLNNTDLVDRAMKESKLSVNKNPELSRDLLRMALDLLDNRTTAEYDDILISFTKRFRENYSFNYSRQRLDDFFCDLAEYVRPELMSVI